MSTFRRYLIAQKRKKKRKKAFFNPFERSVFCHIFNLGWEFASIPGGTQKSTKIHLNFMQSGPPLKLHTSHQMWRWRCWCPVKNTRFTSVDMDSKGKKRFSFTHQNVITYACITIHIRYANLLGMIFSAANYIYIIITNP